MSCSLWLELTPYCNLNCAFCYNPWRGRAAAELPSPQGLDWSAVVERIGGRVWFEYVALSGGEPLLAPNLVKIVDQLSQQGHRAIVTTNGRTATERKLRELAHVGLTGLQVPLLSVEPDVHDRLSGRPSWRRAMRTILLARAMGLQVALTFVATADNVAEFPRVSGLASRLGIKDIVFNEVHLEGQAKRKDVRQPPVAASTAALDATDALRLDIRVHVRASSARLRAALGTASLGPGAPWHRVAVDPAGNVKLCNQSTSSVGNVRDMTADDFVSLVAELEAGQLSRLRHTVSNCACMNDRFAGAAA